MDLGDEVKLRWIDEEEWRLVRFEGYDRGFMIFSCVISAERMVARSSSVEISDISTDGHR